MIKIFYIFILLFCHLIASDKIEANVSVEYWLSEETRIFSIDNVLMLEIEDDKVEPGTIIQEIQSGFMFGERLLRPSFVGISKKKDTSLIINKVSEV